MTFSEFLIVWGICLATMLACRCIPIFVLKGRDLPDWLSNALGLIPPAAFAALVANDLFGSALFEGDVWNGLVPFVSAAIVVFVARRTRSLIWCAVCGVAAFALLSLL